MKGFPTRAHVEALRKQYPKGTKVRMIRMADDPHPVPVGMVGEVTFVDDIGSVFTRWQNGSGLAFIPGEDAVEIITEEEYTKGTVEHEDD